MAANSLVVTRLRDNTYLRFRQRERLRQLLPFGADHVVIFLERVLELQQLAGAERCPYSLRLPERLQEEPGDVGTCNEFSHSKYYKNIIADSPFLQ